MAPFVKVADLINVYKERSFVGDNLPASTHGEFLNLIAEVVRKVWVLGDLNVKIKPQPWIKHNSLECCLVVQGYCYLNWLETCVLLQFKTDLKLFCATQYLSVIFFYGSILHQPNID